MIIPGLALEWIRAQSRLAMSERRVAALASRMVEVAGGESQIGASSNLVTTSRV